MARIPQHTSASTPAVPQWSLGTSPWQDIPPTTTARPRVIIDNDFSGDPDDLFQLVHHLLSPTVDIRLVVCSHLRPEDPFDPSRATAANAELVVHDVFSRMGLSSREIIVRGSDSALPDRSTPQDAPAVDAIIAEALREDVDTPLLYVAGGGLTDLASAYLREPRIADKLVVIWIGGPEHGQLAKPPVGGMPIEYNLLIDLTAGQVVFNDSDLQLWQVPRNVYRQCLVSESELRRRVAATGALGRHLYEELVAVAQVTGLTLTTYAFGDSPLVLLTALLSFFEPDSASSAHVELPVPSITDDGQYADPAAERTMRVYTWVDTRLMFEDFFVKLEEFARWQGA